MNYVFLSLHGSGGMFQAPWVVGVVIALAVAVAAQRLAVVVAAQRPELHVHGPARSLAPVVL